MLYLYLNNFLDVKFIHYDLSLFAYVQIDESFTDVVNQLLEKFGRVFQSLLNKKTVTAKFNKPLTVVQMKQFA